MRETQVKAKNVILKVDFITVLAFTDKTSRTTLETNIH